MSIVDIKALIQAGVHYGTKSSKWHPKMAPYIWGKRKDVHIINLRETARALIQAHYFVAKLAKANKTILFVGTKRQAKDIVRNAARGVGMPYVAERWLGGTLTNIETIRASIRNLDKIEEEMARSDYSHNESKKAMARHARQRRRILRNLEGVRNMTKLPDALVVIDPTKESTAVHEAHILGIPIVSLLDTDCDPQQVNLPIPGNDDGIRSIQATVNVIVEGIRKGRSEQVTKSAEAEPGEQKAEGEAAKAEETKAAEAKA